MITPLRPMLLTYAACSRVASRTVPIHRPQELDRDLMQTKRNVLLLLFLFGFCIASLAQDAPKTYSALNGMWHITGARDPRQHPFLALSFAVNGDTVYGSGSLELTCSNKSGVVGTGVFVTGKIAQDGSFLLTSTKGEARIGQQVSIKGKVPAEGATTWAGSLTIVYATARPRPDCEFRLSRDFVATPYPALSGTYTGTITGPDLGGELTVSLKITQGQVTADDTFGPNESARPDEPSPALERFYTPLNATITVSGYRSFTAEAVAVNRHKGANQIDGDRFRLEFPLEDGSTLTLNGWYPKISESTLVVVYNTLVNGRFTKEEGSGKFTRQ
jgi:hypothetical protein